MSIWSKFFAIDRWRNHDGLGRPVSRNTWVEIKRRDGTQIKGQACDFLWCHLAQDGPIDIVAYRVIL